VPVEVLALAGENYNVLGPVISPVSVDVVHNFSGSKDSAKQTLSDNTVFMPTELLCVGFTLSRIKPGATELLAYLLGHSRRIELCVHQLHVAGTATERAFRPFPPARVSVDWSSATSAVFDEVVFLPHSITSTLTVTRTLSVPTSR